MVTDDRVRVAIVGGGITGLAAAAWLEHDRGIADVAVLESSDRPGGKIRTARESGHVLEWGPQGYLDSAPDTAELASLAGLADHVVAADEASADRFIVRDGTLRSVPTSAPAFLRSDVLPLAGRLRVLAEPFARSRPDGEESVFEFAKRRIGRRAAEVLVDAMVTGVFAGDSTKLSLEATFPRMAAMEAEHGSLTAALFAKVMEARREGRRSSGPAGPGGRLTSFRSGMQQLPDAIGGRLGDRLSLSTGVLEITQEDGRYRLETAVGAVIADRVLLTVPAAEAARILARLAPSGIDPLQGIPTVPIAVAMTSYADSDAFGKAVRGFGFLVPRGEDLGVLGTLFCHDIFREHAPEGGLFLRTMIGGARDPSAVDLDDQRLLDRTRGALRQALGGDPDPDRAWVVRWQDGISQYTLGHIDRVKAAEAAAASAGVELAGSPYRGVSVNDCIKQARAAAASIAERLEE
jgi:oxygen-dependent protoporphyrinogen oxidase